MTWDPGRLARRLRVPSGTPTQHRTGVIDVVNGDGTVDVTLAGEVIPSVPIVQEATVGDSVQLLVWQGDLLALVVHTRYTDTEADARVAAALATLGLSDITPWANYTPALTATTTNPTLGAGSAVAGRWQRGPNGLITAAVYIQFGTSGTNAGSGNYRVSVPVNIDSGVDGSVDVGGGTIATNVGGATGAVTVRCQRATATTVRMLATASGQIAHNVPHAWGANNTIRLLLNFEEA